MGKKQKPESWYDNIYLTGGHDGMYRLPVEQFADHKIWKEVLRLIPKDRKIVDVGCGVGMLAELCNKTGHNYFWGFDFSDIALSQAERRAPGRAFTWVDFSRQQIPRIKESAYLIFEVLEHIENDLQILNNIPSGCDVFITVPNFDSESHVRHFDSLDGAAQRYGPYLAITELREYPTNDTNKIFLIAGIKKEWKST